MLKAHFDRVMERRSDKLIAQIGGWLPAQGPVLDLGSGTGHLSARLEREFNLEMVPADVVDIHVMGRVPVRIGEGALPFDAKTFTAALLIFMLHYPDDAARVLAEAARTTHGPIILVQSVYSGRVGYAWLRVREFVWTYIAFHVSKVIGYVPRASKFSMNARRFYSDVSLARVVRDAGLRVRSRRDRPVLPGGLLMVASMLLEADD